MKELLLPAINAAIDAGNAIMKIYQTDFEVEYKEDQSPLTIADQIAHNIIENRLIKLRIPILSEEGKSILYMDRKSWRELWIVDPLDGTKEFVKKNGEFTVNIALVKDSVPVMGVVYAPSLNELYFGQSGLGAFKTTGLNKDLILELDKLTSQSNRLPLSKNKSYYGIVASRSHLNPETTEFINVIRQDKTDVKIVSKGSSLKLCLVAEGVADVYPRFAPTSEWDTAAGHAIVLASGGKVVKAENPSETLIYNKEDIINPWFIVYGKSS